MIKRFGGEGIPKIFGIFGGCKIGSDEVPKICEVDSGHLVDDHGCVDCFMDACNLELFREMDEEENLWMRGNEFWESING